MSSAFLRLNWSDLGKGLLVAVGAAVFAKLGEVMNAPGFDFISYDWHSLVSLAIAAGGSYVVKNLFQDGNGVLLGNEPKV